MIMSIELKEPLLERDNGGTSVLADISVKSVNKNHERFMENGGTIDPHQLITILGGADAILHHYLSSDNLSQLSIKQLHQINDALTLKSETNKWTDKDYTSPIIQLSPENTIIHQKLGVRIGNKFRNIIFNQWLWCFIILMAVIFIMLRILNAFSVIAGYSSIAYFIYNTIIYIICIIMCLSVLLLTNKKTIGYILQTFEFYLKFICAIRYWIFATMYDRKYVESITKYSTNNYIMYHTVIFMIVLIFCFADGLKISPRRKSLSVFIFTGFLTWFAINWTFTRNEVYYYDLGLVSINVVEFAASSITIITIFAWKQMIFSLYLPKKSTLIKKSVKIVWL